MLCTQLKSDKKYDQRLTASIELCKYLKKEDESYFLNLIDDFAE